MSNRRRDVDTLRRIVEVRRLREEASEQALAVATVAVRSAVATEENADRRLAARQNAWVQALRGGRFDPALAAAFTQAVHEADRALAQARAETAAAEAQREVCNSAFQQAEAERDAAEQVRDTATRLHRRKLEEARLNEVSDSVARRRVTS